MSPLLKSHFCIAVAAAALLVGCSSGGESGTGATANNQTSQGVITGLAVSLSMVLNTTLIRHLCPLMACRPQNPVLRWVW